LSVLLENSFVLRGELLGALMLEKAVKKLMNIEKKLIACSILAIVIGIATIVPLALVMPPARAEPDTNDQTPQATAEPGINDQPQFTFDMSYAYIRDVWDNSTLTPDTYGWAFALAFTTSPNFDVADLDSKVIYETYRAELTTEKGSIENITLSTFAIGNNSPPMNFSFYLNQWYNLTGSKDCAGRAGSANGNSTDSEMELTKTGT
jgi:hypothetical protein